MTEKVTLPADIAKALKENEGDAILYDIESMARSGFGSIGMLYRFCKENPRKYFDALVNGYQVEATPEEKVREYYESLDVKVRDSYEAEGVRNTLDLLGIQIEGVNA